MKQTTYWLGIISEKVPNFGTEREVGVSVAFTARDASCLPLDGSPTGVRVRALEGEEPNKTNRENGQLWWLWAQGEWARLFNGGDLAAT